MVVAGRNFGLGSSRPAAALFTEGYLPPDTVNILRSPKVTAAGQGSGS
jgi:hypothetical protein